MTERDRADELCRGRFDAATEREFRDHYEHRFVEALRSAAWVVLAFFLLVRVGLLALGTLGLNSLVGTAFGALALGALLLCVYRPDLHRYVHEATSVGILAVGASFVPFWLPFLFPVQSPARAASGVQSVLIYLVILLIFTYTLSRLRFVYASLVGAALSLFYASYVSGVLMNQRGAVPPLTLALLAAAVLAVNGMGMVASFWTERYARRDFLLSRLLEEEHERSERLLLNILPEPVADRLKEAHDEDRPAEVVDSFAQVTVLFADIVGFTTLSMRMTPEELVRLLNSVFSAFDALAERHGLEKIKTIGDAYMAVAGLPTPRPDHAAAMAEMALDMQAEVARLARERGMPLALRVGLNSGPVVAGVIGTKKFIYDLWGDTVNTASRMESHGEPGRIQVTEATAALLSARYVLEERGVIALKGRGEMAAFWLKGRRGTVS